MSKKVVFVGLSGGVDSAVSVALLKKQGYDVVGVFIKTWHPDFLVCNEEEERRDAMRVSAYLDIPFLTFDLEDVYKKEVADYMIREYEMGRTPNPDVMCNKEVKFGAFFKKAIEMGADYVATGHYATKQNYPEFFSGSRVARIKSDGFNQTSSKNSGNFCLAKGIDPSKDQSYFLWTLKQEQLEKILFPIGHLKKTEVRKLAKKFNLPVAEKKDSQGICFLGDIDLKEFLKHYIKEKKGKVLNEKGETIGYHDGVVFHTLGERHGFTITKKNPNDGAYYVVDKDIKKNILIVAQGGNLLSESPRKILLNFRSRLSSSASIAFHKKDFHLALENVNWISEVPISYKLEAKSYVCQVRYHGEFLPCKIKCSTPSVTQTKVSRTVLDTKTVEVIFGKPVLVASGQSCVIYDKDVCLGGGVVV